jgi:YD repeat-containing protein
MFMSLFNSNDSYKIKKLETSLVDIVTVNNHIITYTYNSDSSVQSTTEKDGANNTIKTVTYTYNSVGDVATSVTVMNGKTVTTTYNYDTNGNITSTSNVIS